MIASNGAKPSVSGTNVKWYSVVGDHAHGLLSTVPDRMTFLDRPRHHPDRMTKRFHPIEVIGAMAARGSERATSR
jgi:hypothetical protein